MFSRQTFTQMITHIEPEDTILVVTLIVYLQSNINIVCDQVRVLCGCVPFNGPDDTQILTLWQKKIAMKIVF